MGEQAGMTSELVLVLEGLSITGVMASGASGTNSKSLEGTLAGNVLWVEFPATLDCVVAQGGEASAGPAGPTLTT